MVRRQGASQRKGTGAALGIHSCVRLKQPKPMRAAAVLPLLALGAALLSDSSTALTTAQIKKNCLATSVCYKGASTSQACTIATDDCPACVVFDGDGCYELVNGACNFGYDCSTYWDSASSSGSSSSVSSSSKTSTTSSKTSGSSSNSATSNSTTSGGSTSSSSTTSGGTSAGSSSSSSGSDMSVVFAIIGAAIGVIAVGVIFLTLVRRSRAANEDDDDIPELPPSKDQVQAPASTSAAGGTYAYYGRGTSNNDNVTTPTHGVVNYYNQQPVQPVLAATSPRVAGRAIPAAPIGVAASSVPQARLAPQPVFQAPVQQTSYAASNVHQSSYATTQQPLPAEEAPAAGSPKNRRESYEF